MRGEGVYLKSMPLQVSIINGVFFFCLSVMAWLLVEGLWRCLVSLMFSS